jgi:hypothetical protein
VGRAPGGARRAHQGRRRAHQGGPSRSCVLRRDRLELVGRPRFVVETAPGKTTAAAFDGTARLSLFGARACDEQSGLRVMASSV